ncbi:non-receptor serine/threonine protein kinase [Lithospermum erythrorhizon]|uniref:Non-receptor serine/threonine protein kinase n=1 Tax=Lithospermum erythrorhizon TaxID=34254 RepID=A0AAV3PQP4_LITER
MSLKFRKLSGKLGFHYTTLRILLLIYGLFAEIVVLWHHCWFPVNFNLREDSLKKFLMEQPKSHNHPQNFSAQRQTEDHTSESQTFMVDSTDYANSDQKPAERSFPEAKPVHNFSIQTGEEFALEFMRDRVNPKKPLVPNIPSDPSYTSGYSELKGILGISQTGSESGSDISMSTVVERGPKEFERKNSLLNEDKAYYGSGQSRLQNSSGYNIYRTETYASSGASDSSSSKIKVLCSFGGKILPRPSDGKYRYVGGETKIIRISKEISWQELWQKTTAIYNQTHTIKYQLPGEDLDALVSVSGNEDLQNMMEECHVFEDVDGSKKLRMFLFSLNDLDDAQLSLTNSDADSEIQYVVAVNGMSMGSRQNSALHGLASLSSNNMNDLNRQNVEQETRQIKTDFVNVLHDGGHKSEGQQYDYFPPISSYPPFETAVPLPPHDLAQHALAYAYPLSSIQGSQVQESDMKLKADDSTHQEGAWKGNQDLADEQDLSYQFPDNNVKNNFPVEGGLVGSTSNGEPSLKNEGRVEEHQRISVPQEAANMVQAPNLNGNDNDSGGSAFTPESVMLESHPMDLSYFETTDPPPRVFHSERIPREQADFLNRSSKSDDLHSSPFFMVHSHLNDVQQTNVSESAEKLQNLNMNREAENLIATGHPYSGDPQNIVSRLPKMPKSKQGGSNADHETTSTKGDSKSLTVNEGVQTGSGLSAIHRVESAKHTEDPVSILPNIHGHDVTGHISENIQGHSHPSTGRDVKNESHAETSIEPSRSERGDILIDINDRFPSDFLTDIFTKAILSDDPSNVGMLQTDGAGMSVNIENHEPKNWSFFQKLAGDEFSRKDVSLIDQDHIVYEERPTESKFMPLQKDGTSINHVDPRDNFYDDGTVSVPAHANYNESIVQASEAVHYDGLIDNSQVPELEYEGGIEDIRLPPLDPALSEFDINSLQIIDNDDLEELRELGAGTFGTVYHGKWRGTDVAIKRIKKSCFAGRSSEQERMTIEFWREAEILSKLHHPNVVAFYGVVQDGPGGTMATVAEFMVDGSLRHVLLRKDRHLDRRKRIIIAMDAAFGMEYLHSKSIVHFDLKCDNLLVNLKDPSRPICKVGDFGLSKVRRNTLVSGGVRGTLPWMAPELLNGGSNKVSEKVDVFSFGIVLWEILTGEEPYANMHYGAIIGGIVNNTLRPTIPSYCDAEWRKLMEQCWAPNPSVRPSFTEIASRLRVMSMHKKSVHKATS